MLSFNSSIVAYYHAVLASLASYCTIGALTRSMARSEFWLPHHDNINIPPVTCSCLVASWHCWTTWN